MEECLEKRKERHVDAALLQDQDEDDLEQDGVGGGGVMDESKLGPPFGIVLNGHSLVSVGSCVGVVLCLPICGRGLCTTICGCLLVCCNEHNLVSVGSCAGVGLCEVICGHGLMCANLWVWVAYDNPWVWTRVLQF